MASRLSNDAAAIITDKTNSQKWSVFSGDQNQPPTQGKRGYAIVVCVFASLGGLFFGYDQGVTGGVLVMPSFQEDFCIHSPGTMDGYGTKDECTTTDPAMQPEGWTSFHTMFNVTYYVGCIFGAFLANILCDMRGRRITIFAAGFLFCAGTIWVIITPAKQFAVVLWGRVIEGMGVGTSSFSLPIFGAEMAPKELRGMLSGFMQMTVVIGLLAAGIVNVIVETAAEGWRITNGVALLPPFIVMIGIFLVPESPRWLYKAKGKEAAEIALKKLRQTDDVTLELTQIGDALQEEGYGNSSFKELLDPSIRKRLLIAVFLQILQQATGINPMFTYGGLIFKKIIGEGILSLLIFQIVNCLATIPAMYWVDRYGRRSLLLIGAVGMVIGHVVSATTYSIGCSGQGDHATCDSGAGYIIIVFTAFFIFNFAISWGPICWIYPAEIFPMHVRAKAVSLSTMSNWTMGALMIAIPKLFPYLHINGVYFLFGGLCSLAALFVWYMCPETKGIFLEDIELLFNGVSKQSPLTIGAGNYDGIDTPQKDILEKAA